MDNLDEHLWRWWLLDRPIVVQSLEKCDISHDKLRSGVKVSILNKSAKIKPILAHKCTIKGVYDD